MKVSCLGMSGGRDWTGRTGRVESINKRRWAEPGRARTERDRGGPTSRDEDPGNTEIIQY